MQILLDAENAEGGKDGAEAGNAAAAAPEENCWHRFLHRFDHDHLKAVDHHEKNRLEESLERIDGMERKEDEEEAV